MVEFDGILELECVDICNFDSQIGRTRYKLILQEASAIYEFLVSIANASDNSE